MSCPAGFEQGSFQTCRAQCPPEFKVVQEFQAVGGIRTRCIHLLDNTQSFDLQSLARVQSGQPVPPEYDTEKSRVQTEAVRVRAAANAADDRRRLLNDANDAKRPQVNEFSRIQSEYATFKDVAASAKEVQSIKDSLRVFRPPTAPSSDLEKERQAILTISREKVFFLQAVLLILVLALIGYAVLPIDWAHGIAFLLLCTAISIGFFLRR